MLKAKYHIGEDGQMKATYYIESFETQNDYNKAVAKFMDLFSRSISEGITHEDKAIMDDLEKAIKLSKFYK